jgi:hypothetical protein
MPTKRPIIQVVVTESIKEWVSRERTEMGISESAFVQLILRRAMKNNIRIDAKIIDYDPKTGKLIHR